MTNSENIDKLKSCPESFILAVNDTLNVVNGKWKIPIIAALLYGEKRFKELERGIPKITPRMLSKELRDLEMNGIVSRTVYETIPVSVVYSLTKAGQSFTSVLDVMIQWGLKHRKEILNK